VTTSLTKGWQILDFVAATDAPVSIRQLATGTGLPKSTFHRLASELQEWGALDVVPGGYQLGFRLFELGGSRFASIGSKRQRGRTWRRSSKLRAA
jgi:DNA-binding IclR family transcriptional regulator